MPSTSLTVAAYMRAMEWASVNMFPAGNSAARKARELMFSWVMPPTAPAFMKAEPGPVKVLHQGPRHGGVQPHRACAKSVTRSSMEL